MLSAGEKNNNNADVQKYNLPLFSSFLLPEMYEMVECGRESKTAEMYTQGEIRIFNERLLFWYLSVAPHTREYEVPWPFLLWEPGAGPLLTLGGSKNALSFIGIPLKQ